MYNKYKCAHKRGLIKIAVCYNNNNFGVPPSLLPATALCCRGAFQSGWHGRRLPITVVGRSVGGQDVIGWNWRIILFIMSILPSIVVCGPFSALSFI